MGEFSMDDSKLEYIADTFGLTPSSVKQWYTEYSKMNDDSKSMYLAHVMRVLEEYVREKENAPAFRITCTPSSLNAALKGNGTAIYSKGQYFNILFDSSLSGKEARVVIAHELGHLFFIAINGQPYNKQHEPLSSLFGVFTIMDKNLFYQERASDFQHNTWQDIVSDFRNLTK